MGRMTYLCGITDDKQSVILEMSDDQKPLAHMIFDSSGVDQLIHQLAQFRSLLTETVAPELDPGARVPVEQFPAWRIPDRHNGPAGTILMALRHQDMGWLGFLLEEERARAIGKALSETCISQSKSP